VPSDLALKTMNAVHRTVLTLSGGRIGWSAANMPVLELTTTGRKSGQPRSCLLTSPVQEGDALVIVASRGGDDRDPAWFLNLRDEPEVQVALGGEEPAPYRAEIADAEERARLWPMITADHSNYAGYQRKTDREIPVVVLHPAA
jgi:deazaflavin-dependent oxidoreductase (nitroreductase family)